jgi:GNAT superfamily N-acetyltransferase
MLVIRKATREDVPTILSLVKALAAYEREPDAVDATEADFLRDGFGDDPAFHVHVATEARGGGDDGEVIGFALWFFTYSTWRGRRCLHVEDLFVLPEHRGKGVGFALMKTLAREAVEHGCARFVWQVLDWNAPAIEFYRRIGARVMKEWVAARIDGEALRRLAC